MMDLICYPLMFSGQFEFTPEGCDAAKYFIKWLRKYGHQVPVYLDQSSGYEIVIVANQKLKEVTGL